MATKNDRTAKGLPKLQKQKLEQTKDEDRVSWVGTLISIIMIVLFVLTFMTESKLSMEYVKAYFKSGIKAVSWVKEQFKEDKQTTDEFIVEKE